MTTQSNNKRELLIVIDPASQRTGIGLHDVRRNNPVRGSFQVLNSNGKTRQERISSMKAALRYYVEYQIWEKVKREECQIVGAVMEFPAHDNRDHSHTTSFVLGMVFQKLRDYLYEEQGIPIIEVLPGESSVAVGAGRRNASKEQRNTAVCLYTGGQLDLSKKSSPRCAGGLLDGCGPDELDAAAAGFAGRQKMQDVARGLDCDEFPPELRKYAVGILG